jgi:hypothetical protein
MSGNGDMGIGAIGEAAMVACRDLLGVDPLRVGFPGGERRKSVRVHLADGGSVIATRRRRGGRAELEVVALRQIGRTSDRVPRVLAFDGTWLIQEDLGDRRLSAALADGGPDGIRALLGRAIGSLAEVQAAGRGGDVGRRAPVIGRRAGWLDRLLAMPGRIGDGLGVPAPDLDQAVLRGVLHPVDPAFVKWDARPGNAMLRGDGTVAWVDWEHCGRRDPLDDVAWLLFDEFTPDLPEIEGPVLDGMLRPFAAGRDADACRSYLAMFGTFHTCVRLDLVLAHKGDGDWWDFDDCLRRDRIGVTRDCALRLCRRAARWSARDPRVANLAPWWERVARAVSQG